MTDDHCSFDGCDRPVHARGVCSVCYQRIRYHGKLDTLTAQVPERPCTFCGVAFRPKTMRSDAEYCSRKCIDAERTRRRRASNHYETMGCHQCGKTLVKKRSDARFCSEACGQIWHNANMRNKRSTVRAELKTPCKVCGEHCPPPRRTYCSDECQAKGRTADRYGLTSTDYKALVELRGGSCAICGSSDWGVKGPQIDHDHETGKVRGILCVNCNNALGRFKEDPDVILRAAEYLEQHATSCPSCEEVATTT